MKRATFLFFLALALLKLNSVAGVTGCFDNASTLGSFTGTVSLANSDVSRNPFSFSVMGIVREATVPPVLTIAGLTNGLFQLTITSQTGRNYVVEASTNLLNWDMVYSNLAAGTTLQFTDTNASSFKSLFHRAFVQ